MALTAAAAAAASRLTAREQHRRVFPQSHFRYHRQAVINSPAAGPAGLLARRATRVRYQSVARPYSTDERYADCNVLRHAA